MALVDEHFQCGICLEVAEDAVETCCCHNIFCQNCVTGVHSCPMCRKTLKVTDSHVVRRLIGNLRSSCEYCLNDFSRSDLKSHSKVCPDRYVSCKAPNCKEKVASGDLKEHLIKQHIDEIISGNIKLVTGSVEPLPGSVEDLICRKFNRFGNEARLGNTGKFYCGQRSDSSCSCCNGMCGPGNGCNCSGCFELDLITRNLPPGYFVNKEGYPVREGDLWEGEVRMYCGRKVMPIKTTTGHHTDGYCGDDDGENCLSCKIIQQQVHFTGCYYYVVNKN